jgi:tRNA wybutosine-synthesizing protein 2
LWSGILREILAASGCDIPPTHLAVNEGIPARITQAEGDGAAIASPEDVDDGAFQETDDGAFQETNVVRRPGLRLLYGDFGPGPTRTLIENPTEKDFEEAFWVKTRQNGIWQVWAPLYTMFSRGNVKEKARLLDFHKGRDDDGRFDERRVRDGWAVDLYAGIGYFSFSYARLGMRVLCWEINPWSTHALYRGAKLNGWRAMVFDGTVSDDDLPVTVIEKGVFDPSRPQIVIFPEDNTRARRRINQLREFAEADPEKYSSLDIVHVNCGLLPSSSAIWRDTLDMVSSRGGWLHLHENVGVADIETRAREIRGIFDGWLADEGKGRKADVEHVERVKTFAPGVWHCVFDVYVTGPESTSTVT